MSLVSTNVNNFTSLTIFQDTEPAPLSALLTSHLLPALQLHLLPKSALDVHLLILESDVLPNVLSAGLTVASAAIADAGIQMTALGIGVTVSQTAAGMMVDMDVDEEDEAASVSLGVMPALGQLSGVWLAGELEIDEACAVGDSYTSHNTSPDEISDDRKRHCWIKIRPYCCCSHALDPSRTVWPCFRRRFESNKVKKRTGPPTSLHVYYCKTQFKRDELPITSSPYQVNGASNRVGEQVLPGLPRLIPHRGHSPRRRG